MPDSVVVTGATSGIGWELALLAARQGFAVHAVGRNEARLASLVEEAPGIVTHQCDLAHVGSVVALGQHLAGGIDSLTTLFNNAAVQHDVLFDDLGYSAEDAAAEATTNLVAPIVLSRALWPALTAGGGSVVNISSGLAIVPKRSAAVYCATKAGLSSFSAALARQNHAVRAIDVILPLVDTPMTAGRGAGKLEPATVAVQVLRAAEGHSGRVGIGKARALPMIHRLSPRLARHLLDRS